MSDVSKSGKDLFDTQNPLINPPALPFGVPALDRIKNEHFLPAIRYGIALGKERTEQVRDNPAPATFENTIEALEYADEDLTRIGAVFSALCSSCSSDELREIEEIADVEMSHYHSDIMLDEKLFARVKSVHDQKDKLGLRADQKKLLEDSYKGFVRSGALLDEVQKKRKRELSEALAVSCTKFGNNETKATEAYKKLVEDETQLVGVPERAKKLFQRFAKEEGYENGWLIKLEPYPMEVMTHADNRTLREEIYRAYAGQCYKGEFDNCGLVVDIVRLRDESARQLGFATYADFVLAERMAGDVKTVQDFLEKNLAMYKPAAEKELAALRTFAKERDGIDVLKAWDIAYYTRTLKEKTFNFEVESLRPYFRLEPVIDGLFHHAERLFAIEIREENTGKYPVYHEDVKVFEVFDKGSSDVIGLLYADYYARAGAKRGGAWMSEFRSRSLRDGKLQIPLIINNCNFAKPTPQEPTFLSLLEVETMFHEFGHALHGLLSQTRYVSQAGPNVKWDFVELPSQVQENWVSEKETLDTFARHHETGEPISAEIVKTIQDMRNFDVGWSGLRQTFFGLLDMAYYAQSIDKIQGAEQVEGAVAARATLIPREAGLMSVQFAHIFAGGYGAGYYSYKWAEVLDADVFSVFKARGLYDPETARKLRTLYAKGGSEEPMDLFVEMMGRKPDPSALFRREGLL